MMIKKLLQYRFLFEELVKRDFKKKYKRTILGVGWSVLSPLFTLVVMKIVFTQLFGRTMEHYTTYLFCGNLIYTYFAQASDQGMSSLISNAAIFTKVTVPKYMFLLSKNVQTLINFLLTLIVFFIMCFFDNVSFTWKFVMLVYPIALLLIFNIGLGLILSALFVFFRDLQYLWSIFMMVIMYTSAIFYDVARYPEESRWLFNLNPIYCFITYFRSIVLDTTIPTVGYHLLLLGYTAIVLLIGCIMYIKNNHSFLYYV